MPQSHAAVYVHWVFSTKQRKPFLKDLEVRKQVHSALGGIAKRLECMPIVVGGVSDHVHMLTTLSRNLKMSDAVKEFKRSSNNWIKENHSIDGFKWQAGYGAFSVSQSKLDAVKQYIENQEEHHRTKSFKEEFRSLLTKHGLEIDEKYCWD